MQELELVEKAKQAPLKAFSICKEISSPDIQEECFSSSAQNLNGAPKQKEALCDELSGSLKGECFFELAEEVQKVEFCQRATPFELDCRLHILEAQCGKFSSLSSLLSLTKNLELDYSHPNVGNILYGCLLSHPQPRDICSQTPNPKQCIQIQERQRSH